MHRFRPSWLIAAAWALIELVHARRLVRCGLPKPGAIWRPPPLPDHARRAVEAVMVRSRSSCLVQALVLQAWDAAHREPRDIIVGVKPLATFGAHAWLDGDYAPDRKFSELLRIPAARADLE